MFHITDSLYTLYVFSLYTVSLTNAQSQISIRYSDLPRVSKGHGAESEKGHIRADENILRASGQNY